MDNLKEKLKKVKPKVEKLQNNNGTNVLLNGLAEQKHKLEVEEAILAKKMRLNC